MFHVREVAISYRGPRRAAPQLTNPAEVAAFVRRVLGEHPNREHFLALYADGQHRVIGYQTVSTGAASASLVHPREVFQPAVMLGACAVVAAHNHPSGEPAPSAEDRALTSRLKQAGELLGIALLDHVVVGTDGRYSSMAELLAE